MASIWPVYEGREPTIGEPWAELPLAEAIDLFELKPQDLVSDLSKTLRFGNANHELLYAGYKYIVVEVGVSEARRAKWKPGFYRSPIKPEEAFRRLIQQALAAELGNNNVVRVDYEPATDSQGRGALKITVVIAADAIKRLRNGAALNALVRLQERLREMGERRTPIIQYATEAELQQDGGP